MLINKVVSLFNAFVGFVLLLITIWYPDLYIAGKLSASGLLFLAISIFFYCFDFDEAGKRM